MTHMRMISVVHEVLHPINGKRMSQDVIDYQNELPMKRFRQNGSEDSQALPMNGSTDNGKIADINMEEVDSTEETKPKEINSRPMSVQEGQSWICVGGYSPSIVQSYCQPCIAFRGDCY